MSNKKNVFIIGYGSIGQRHARILTELGYKVAVISKRMVDYPSLYPCIKEALLNEQPVYVVVANETNEHEDTLNQLNSLGYNKRILVEKPLYPTRNNNQQKNSSLYVGYNLRFHPIVQTLYRKLSNTDIISVQCYVGQYLPSWRPGTDYSQSYSASLSKGGGVLRDLSHELDYLQFLFGEWQQMTASGGKFSDLNIESDDHFTFIYETKNVPIVTLQMNYLDHLTQRLLVINTNTETYKADFNNNTLQINDEILQFEVGRDDTYRNQHMAVLNGENEFLCTYEEGLKIVKMIEMAELASLKKVWVSNE